MHAWRAQMHASRAHVHASRAHAVSDTCVEERERRGPLLALWLARPLLPIPQAAANGAKPRVGRTRYRSSLWACAAHIKRSVGCGSSNWRKQKGSRLKVDIVIVDSRARCAKEPAGRRAAMLRMQVGEHTEGIVSKSTNECVTRFFSRQMVGDGAVAESSGPTLQAMWGAGPLDELHEKGFVRFGVVGNLGPGRATADVANRLGLMAVCAFAFSCRATADVASQLRLMACVRRLPTGRDCEPACVWRVRMSSCRLFLPLCGLSPLFGLSPNSGFLLPADAIHRHYGKQSALAVRGDGRSPLLRLCDWRPHGLSEPHPSGLCQRVLSRARTKRLRWPRAYR